MAALSNTAKARDMKNKITYILASNTDVFKQILFFKWEEFSIAAKFQLLDIRIENRSNTKSLKKIYRRKCVRITQEIFFESIDRYNGKPQIKERVLNK